jgi:uncharacterized repeat protein (TIGR01451 family)
LPESKESQEAAPVSREAEEKPPKARPEQEGSTMSARKTTIALLAIVAWTLVPLSQAHAAGPAWSVSITSFPASFIAGESGDAIDGPAVRVNAQNIGDGPTTGAYSVKTILPAEFKPGSGISGKDQLGNPLSCAAAGQVVTCTTSAPLAAGGSAAITIPVDVDAGVQAGSSLRVEASAEGGGAAKVSTVRSIGVGIPAWAPLGIPLPTNFAPGTKNEILVSVPNIGTAATSGTVTITDTLPAGLKPVSAGAIGASAEFGGSSCGIAGQTVSCTQVGSVPADLEAEVSVIVAVDPLAPPGTHSDQITVEGGGAAPAFASTPITVSAGIPAFGFVGDDDKGFRAPLTGPDGSPATQAGSHPNRQIIEFSFPTERPGGSLGAAGHVHGASADLPRGLIANPSATPVLCTEAQMLTIETPGCPAASQIGTATVLTLAAVPEGATRPLFNMVPPPGSPSSFAFDAANSGSLVHILGGVRGDREFELSGGSADAIALTFHPVFGVRVEFWGDPTSGSHDRARGGCGLASHDCPVEPNETAFLTLPTDCPGTPMQTVGRADSWEQLGLFHESVYESADLAGEEVTVSGCNQLHFEPTIDVKPTTNLTDSPSGLEVKLHQPQDTQLGHLSTAAMKDTTVTLPEGMSANPSQADGRAACSSAQIGMTTAVGQSPPHFSMAPDSCPDAAKLGTVEVSTPLLNQYGADHKLAKDPETGNPIPEPLHGSVYLAKPFENPFGSLLAIYLSINDARTGTIAKLAGQVIPDPQTGQLTTRFTRNPELPVEDIELRLFPGARAPLVTPPTCATHTTRANLIPWSSPEGAEVNLQSSFETLVTPAGGQCPTSADQSPHVPAFSAGTIAPQAGAYSPFVLKLSRQDGTQRLAGIDTTLPPGLIGKLAGVGECSEGQIAVALSRSHPNEGILERQSPSCPSTSEVGTVDVAAGAGPNPLHTQGTAYLSGPYKGAPLSLTIITPAIAGPFDLGAVVVRTALHVNPESARIHAVSDPFPQVLEGIPLDLRSVALKMDRPDFTLNPTSCDPMAITGSALSALGQASALTSPFQVGGCSSLGFKPKLAISLKGPTTRGGHPALTATLTIPKGGPFANIAKTSVALPRSEFLDQAHIRTVCTRVQFAASQCPAGSIYGKAKAITPLLDEPLEGPVYLRSSDHELPDLVIDLNGKIHVTIAGRIDSLKGAIRTNFEAIPDAPVTRFTLQMQGGKKGLLQNSRNLCAAPARAVALFDAQNGKAHDVTPLVKSKCKAKPRKKGKKGHGGR